MTTRLALCAFLAVLFVQASPLRAQTHARAPQQPQQLQQTTTRNTQSATEPLVVSDAEISAGVRKYISTHAGKSADKKFHVRSGGKDVALDLVTIHDDRLSDLGGNKHFVCVDMKAASGVIYDIDFFITVSSGTLSVTEASVHKINGKPLYNWKEENGVWKKVPVS